MAVLEITQREGNVGIVKTIDEAAFNLIFDIAQKEQYSEPERSTIRELVSNGLDAEKEKRVALQILQESADPNKFYLTREEALLADSNWMPEYYDPTWLNHEERYVDIRYIEQPDKLRDLLEIEDRGVGIGNIVNQATGKSRLSGVLKLGYSTKRNATFQLGKFGMGAKAALSTGANYYTMKTRHNGLEYEFEIYDYKIESIVPRFSEDGQLNQKFVLDKGKETEYSGYCRKTTKLNGTIISVPVKKHHKSTYISGAQTQLLYFDNVRMSVIDANGNSSDIPLKAKIQYEDEHIILSESSQYSKPHIIMGGINYGYVNYQELELQDILGSIGFKVDASSVTVHPSRERLIWNDKTRAAILQMQQIVADTATKFIQAELKQTDIIKWALACSEIASRSYNKTTVIGKLVGIADIKDTSYYYPHNQAIKYCELHDFFAGYEITFVTRFKSYLKNGTPTWKLNRANQLSWSYLKNYPIYLQKGETSPLKEHSVLKLHENGFVKFRKVSKPTDNELNFDGIETLYQGHFKGKTDFYLQSVAELFEDAEGINNLDNVVPDIEVVETKKEEEKQEKLAVLTPKQRRQMEGKMVYHLLKYDSMFTVNRNYYDNDYDKCSERGKELVRGLSAYKFYKEESTIAFMVDKCETETIIWGTTADEELLISVRMMCVKNNVQIIKVSLETAKYMPAHSHVNNFILSINHELKSVSMSNELVKYHTARNINNHLREMAFLSNFKQFNPEMADLFKELREYCSNYFVDYNTDKSNWLNTKGLKPEIHKELNDYSDKVTELQIYIDENKDNPLAIAAKARAIFETPKEHPTFEVALGVDLPVYRKLQILLEYIEPYKALLNHISPLCVSNSYIPEDLEAEINHYIATKS